MIRERRSIRFRLALRTRGGPSKIKKTPHPENITAFLAGRGGARGSRWRTAWSRTTAVYVSGLVVFLDVASSSARTTRCTPVGCACRRAGEIGLTPPQAKVERLAPRTSMTQHRPTRRHGSAKGQHGSARERGAAIMNAVAVNTARRARSKKSETIKIDQKRQR